MLHHLRLGDLSAAVTSVGAELRSLRRGDDDYLWQGSGADCGTEPQGLGSAALQFPHVGRLREDGFAHAGRFYALPPHGIAGSSQFRLIERAAHSLTLTLRADSHTRECYPFDFELRVTFTLRSDGLVVDYRVRNRGLERMAFSLGSQASLALPLPPGEGLADWMVGFDCAEAPEVYQLDGRLLGSLPQPFEFKPRQSVQLGSQQFVAGGLVFKNINSRRLDLLHRRHGRRLALHTGAAPHLCLWSRPGAEFVTIAPWYGVDDDAQTPLELLAKPAAILLPAGRAFVAGYRIELG